MNIFKSSLLALSLALAFSASGALAQGVWTSQASGTLNQLNGVAWTGSGFIAVGNSGSFGTTPGTILTSPDGVIWTARTAPSNYHLVGVVWAGTQAVVVGGNGTILTSSDGITWTSRTSNTTQPLNGVVWTGTQLVVFGANGTILTSPTGVTWTARTAGNNTYQFLAGAVSGNRIVVVGNAVMTSTDGITWTSPTSLAGYDAVAWTGTQFVAVGQSQLVGSLPSPEATSPDGITWTSQASGNNGSPYALLWTGTLLLSAGQGSALRTSPDGLTWTNQTSGTTANIQGLACSSTLLVGVGNKANGGSTSVTILTSVIGSTAIRRPGEKVSVLTLQGIPGTIQGYRADGRVPVSPTAIQTPAK